METKPSREKLGLLTLGLILAFYAALVWFSIHPSDAWFLVTASLWLAAFAAWIWVEFRNKGEKKRPRGWWLNRVVAAVFIALGLPAFNVVPAFWMVNDFVPRNQIQKNLRQLAGAMLDYHVTHNRFPPAAAFDEDGRPLLSWRVLLLPYLEEDDLYKQFRFDEPWDSPHNIQLLNRMPEVFAPPSQGIQEQADPYTTIYQVFVGPGAAFEGRTGMRRDFPDGASNTILIVTASRAVPWTKPEELVYTPDQPLPPLGVHLIYPSPHTSTTSPLIVFAFADGSTYFINAELITERTLRALITRNGKDTPGPDWTR
jgi:hypothetical protein